MDSSRSGPLTTFIMMLPLIVVPAIAMLRPIDTENGWVSKLLSASDGAKSPDSELDAPDPVNPADEFSAIFGDDSAISTVGNAGASSEALFREAAGESPSANFSEEFQTASATAGEQTPHASFGPISQTDATLNDSTARLIAQLMDMGVTRTLWFSPGDQTVGFVAFFRADQGMLSYRFEAIADSRAAAIQDVMQQVSDWQRNHGR